MKALILLIRKNKFIRGEGEEIGER